jgi:hypothetical protein
MRIALTAFAWNSIGLFASVIVISSKKVYHKIKFLPIWAAAACVCIIVDTNTPIVCESSIG